MKKIKSVCTHCAVGCTVIAEVDNGGAQKFVPKENANPDHLVGKPIYSAWE